ncbi:acetyl-CoA hydrolase/transferase C-terminal domain-containing protein [Oceanicoccus sp. KOV_DT_Chl]|uniref:acetyl-CoA hydrolase/transferase C-terminal domain-containing protein n=1 Tax=Oceanicoccus sp. KOV_DT_Chl TaxID=1904639 RepID=UPI000C7C096A|nr:acetyl-CoA hydrolase/transferase C-terminal domain-containing protein [Oceanicoccus sp. KOV_DT_Chl]
MTDRTTELSLADAVEHIIVATNNHIILAMPLGLGKANQLVNALYQRALKDSTIQLEILTALSLTRPRGSSDLEQRFLTPFVERVYGDYAELDYLAAARRNNLPANITVHEFFVEPASELNHPYVQQHYISSNYTHVARDLNARGVNVIAQMVAQRIENGVSQLSLSCNPEVTLDLMPLLLDRRKQGETIIAVAQIHNELPFMGSDAMVQEGMFDVVIADESCHTRLYSTPNMPVGMVEHFIGMHAASLVKDGGTLQIGIGALGDAVTGALLLRQEDNTSYRQLLADIYEQFPPASICAQIGDDNIFEKGLYGCSEMFTYGLFELFRRGVIKRQVNYRGQNICLHGGFFLGPTALYDGLHQLDDEVRNLLCMTNISYVNHLHGDELEKRRHRVNARFVNTAFTMTLLGAGVADQLEDGRILSGVGGQYNFVAQAHELAGARSILLLRACRERGGECLSNIVWSYGHATIPRHLRDIVITEYGVADLRGKSDSEVIKALLNITDSRFQQELLATAVRHLKIDPNYEIPSVYCNNTPQRLQGIYQQWRKQGFFPEFPLGTDFNITEQALLKALAWLKSKSEPRFMLELARKALVDDDAAEHFHQHLLRMDLAAPKTLKQRLYRQLVLAALQETRA